MDDKKEVIVLMSTYNGRKYIGEQLRSIYGQKGVACSLLVRDDGSTDGTCGLLGAEQDEGRLKWYAGNSRPWKFTVIFSSLSSRLQDVSRRTMDAADSMAALSM